jgi:hypothetical protein
MEKPTELVLKMHDAGHSTDEIIKAARLPHFIVVSAIRQNRPGSEPRTPKFPVRMNVRPKK